MRNHKSLAAAITTALSVTPGIATAIIGNQLDNVNSNQGALMNNVAAGALTNYFGPNLYRPDDRFDFTGGQTIINIPEKGIALATELFSPNSPLVIPTPLTAGGSGQYMALVYTIDGEVVNDFEMTFTLDGGATFADNPILGIRDAAAGTSCVINAPTNSTANNNAWTVTANDGCLSTLTTDEVFRFDGNSTLYQVAVQTAVTAPTSPSSMTFYQLGRPGQLANPIVGLTSQVYGIVPGTAAATAAGTVKATRVDTAKAQADQTLGSTTLTVNSYTNFTVGWSYQCGTAYGPGGTLSGSKSKTIFTVMSNTATATAAGGNPIIVKAVAASIAGIGGFNTAGNPGDGLTMGYCTAGEDIFRVHLKGETVISVGDATKFIANKVYQFDAVDSIGATAVKAASYSYSISGAATNFLSIQTAQYQVTATDSKTSTITVKKVCAQTDATCISSTGLDKTLWGAESLYETVIETGDDWSTTNSVSGVPMQASATGKNVAKFTLKAGMTAPNLALKNNDQIMLLYRLGSITKLAEPGQSINMSVDLKTPSFGVAVNPSRNIPIARSVQAIDAQLKSIEAGKLNIAVSTGETQFSGENVTLGGLEGYLDPLVAQIGQVIIGYNTVDNPVMEDGATPFRFKGSVGGGEVLASKSSLTITGGQFSASATLPGKVTLHLVNDSVDYDADQYTKDQDGNWTAVWNLDTTRLQKIAEATSSGERKGGIVRIQADGKTPINSVENAPSVALKIDYDNNSHMDMVRENFAFRKITRDGTICTVYNVPSYKPPVMPGTDQISIRVTNDSAIAGKLTGKLYNSDGGEPIWTGFLTDTEVPVGATVRFDSENIADITGVSWDGRAVLEITTILPKIEVMAMIRQYGIRQAPLSNLSTGAHGTSCAQN